MDGMNSTNMEKLTTQNNDYQTDICFFTTQNEYEIFSVMSSFDMDCLKDNNNIISINNSRADSPEIMDKIEVPSWRINIVNPATDTELLENLDDEIYNRRHMKHEIEERRRKRWDLQRLRDQQLKMKHGNTQICSYHRRDKSSRNEDLMKFDGEPKFRSFFPDVSDVRFIEVNHEIPVVAFGRPIPRIDKKWFSFPLSIVNDDYTP